MNKAATVTYRLNGKQKVKRFETETACADWVEAVSQRDSIEILRIVWRKSVTA